MSQTTTWKTYIEKMMEAGCKDAAIIGLDGFLWASSATFSPSTYETINLSKSFLNPTEAAQSGVFLAGNNYVTLKADKRAIYGKKNGSGVFCVKTNSSIIIGLYDESEVPGKICNSVEQLADYLCEYGY